MLKYIQTWVHGSAATLFCPGHPGVGKSFLTCTAINHLETTFGTDGGVAVAYIYCNYKRRHEQQLELVVSSLLGQLVRKLRLLPATLQKFYSDHAHKSYRPSIDEHMAILESVKEHFTRTFILIDALDEYTNVSSENSQFLDFIFRIQSILSARLFATSRWIPEVR